MISRVVVFGRLCVSLTGMNLPVLLSRPPMWPFGDFDIIRLGLHALKGTSLRDSGRDPAKTRP